MYGLRLVEATSARKIECKLTSTSSLQSWVKFRCLVFDFGLTIWGAFFSFSNQSFFLPGIGCSWGQRVDWVPFVLKMMMPGSLRTWLCRHVLPALHKAGFAASHNVFEICLSWAEGTGWILTLPLLEIPWWWKHVIRISDNEANITCLHFPNYIQTFPRHPASLPCLDGLCIFCDLLQLEHILDHQSPPFWSWFACHQAKVSSSLLNQSHGLQYLCLRTDVIRYNQAAGSNSMFLLFQTWPV